MSQVPVLNPCPTCFGTLGFTNLISAPASSVLPRHLFSLNLCSISIIAVFAVLVCLGLVLNPRSCIIHCAVLPSEASPAVPLDGRVLVEHMIEMQTTHFHL